MDCSFIKKTFKTFLATILISITPTYALAHKEKPTEHTNNGSPHGNTRTTQAEGDFDHWSPLKDTNGNYIFSGTLGDICILIIIDNRGHIDLTTPGTEDPILNDWLTWGCPYNHPYLSSHNLSSHEKMTVTINVRAIFRLANYISDTVHNTNV